MSAAIMNTRVIKVPNTNSRTLKPSPTNCLTITALKKILLKSAKYFARRSSRLFINDFIIPISTRGVNRLLITITTREERRNEYTKE